MQANYLTLKLAWEFFQKPPQALSPREKTRLADIATQQQEIERRILSSSEAGSVVIPPKTLETRLMEIRQRYASEAEFTQALEEAGLDMHSQQSAVERDLRIEAVLEKVAAAEPAVTRVDAEIYYRLHPEAFDRPESRRLRHLLLTFNNPSEERKAHQQLNQLRSQLTDSMQFAKAALRYSQCPTALNGGDLGVVKRGQLYIELEPAAFMLEAGENSAVLASPIGLHLIRCDEVLPAGMLCFAEVAEKIIHRLTEKRRSEAQKRWIRSLAAHNKGTPKLSEAGL